MAKDTIAFLVMRYGTDINGGAEYHCKMLAERLLSSYCVEVLTTCVKNYVTGENEYAEGEEMINQVLVRRFTANPIERNRESEYAKKAKPAYKWRRFLYKLHLLTPISYLFPVWTYKREDELKHMECNVFHSSKLFSFIKENNHKYRAIIAFSSDFPLIYNAALHAPKKTIAIPTMHYAIDSFRAIQTFVFSRVAYIAFNTTAEQKMAQNIIGRAIAPNGVVSVGVEMPLAANWEETQMKYNLPTNYLLYVGRVDSGKLCRIIEYFLNYKMKSPNSDLKLVLVGGLFMEKVIHPDIIYTGYVLDSEKACLIDQATIVVNPSRFESLSLILLEAMSRGKAMLVYGGCAVLKEHCEQSDYAAYYYYEEKDFISKLHQLEVSEELREQMGKKGKAYVRENYDWTIILMRLKKVIESV